MSSVMQSHRKVAIALEQSAGGGNTMSSITWRADETQNVTNTIIFEESETDNSYVRDISVVMADQTTRAVDGTR